MPTSAVRPAADATEHLFSVSLNGRQITCELRNFGERGVEVQFLSDREPFYGLRLPTYELALEWADAERRAWGWITESDTAPSTEMGLARRVIRPATDR
jgi:hypothetical protein